MLFKGCFMFRPNLLGQHVQPVWPRGLHHRQQGRALPLLEPLQGYQYLYLQYTIILF